MYVSVGSIGGQREGAGGRQGKKVDGQAVGSVDLLTKTNYHCLISTGAQEGKEVKVWSSDKVCSVRQHRQSAT